MSFLEAASLVSMSILAISVFLMLIRLIMGPTLEDRVVALDLITTSAICLIAVYAVLSRQILFLDVAIIIGLIAFIGTAGFAFYLNSRGTK